MPRSPATSMTMPKMIKIQPPSRTKVIKAAAGKTSSRIALSRKTMPNDVSCYQHVVNSHKTPGQRVVNSDRSSILS